MVLIAVMTSLMSTNLLDGEPGLLIHQHGVLMLNLRFSQEEAQSFCLNSLPEPDVVEWQLTEFQYHLSQEGHQNGKAVLK